MGRLAGVDGCPGGWVCIVYDPDTSSFTIGLFRSADALLAHDSKISVMTIDMPIGLVDTGRRQCDELARIMLGSRHVCVSNAPIRPALYAPSRLAASAITKNAAGRGVGSIEWALYPKIINLDVAITPAHQDWCFEIHPEICFCAWNNGMAIQHEKASDRGRQARELLIDAAWPGVRQAMLDQLQQQGHSRQHIALDDVNDAFAALWTSRRKAAGHAQQIPAAPPVDARGLRIEMWY